MNASPSTAAESDGLAARVGALAQLVQRPDFPSADRVAFKRWAPGQPPPLGFYRLFLRTTPDELPAPAQTEAWMLLAWGLCNGIAHRPERALGQALAECGYAEARLERLLAADLDLLPELTAAALRFLAAKGEGCDFVQLARLLLAREAEAREAIHRRIASAYFHHLPRDTQE